LSFNITSEKGKLMVSSITILYCTIPMTFCVVLMLWWKHILYKKRQKDGKEAWNGRNKNGSWEVENSDSAVAVKAQKT
jgi:hypothetical protein